jgi:hypothetical protein
MSCARLSAISRQHSTPATVLSCAFHHMPGNIDLVASRPEESNVFQRRPGEGSERTNKLRTKVQLKVADAEVQPFRNETLRHRRVHPVTLLHPRRSQSTTRGHDHNNVPTIVDALAALTPDHTGALSTTPSKRAPLERLLARCGA